MRSLSYTVFLSYTETPVFIWGFDPIFEGVGRRTYIPFAESCPTVLHMPKWGKNPSVYAGICVGHFLSYIVLHVLHA